MQLVIEKKIADRPKRLRDISPRFSPDFTTQPGTTGVVKTMPVKFKKEQRPEKPTDFSSWSMPEQEMGVIKCREHDFL